VKDITEYTETSSEYELYTHLAEKIVKREISTFADLTEYLAPIIRDKRVHPVVMKIFDLIKALNWGFFRDITKDSHSKIWRELVVPDQRFPEAGRLKETISISSLYVGMLDIHGYTKFCQDSRNNVSRLHVLDKAINNEISRISAQCHAVSRRERGDEIVLAAASATDAITAVLAIIDYFAKTNIVNDPVISTQRSTEANILPEFKISAGITGGSGNIPLIITEKGDLMGFLLNTAARLQARANELSPRESRVMITKQVHINFIKENSVNKSTLFKNNTVYFLDTGQIEFKGVMLPTCEAVFRPEERYKEQFAEDLGRLLLSIKESLWEQKIYLDLMDLIKKAAAVMPPFKMGGRIIVSNIEVVNNDSIIQLSVLAVKTYLQDEDYSGAVGMLHSFSDLMEEIPRFDRLILDYTRNITQKYDMILDSYNRSVDRQIDEKAGSIFSGNYLKTYMAAKNAIGIYEKLRSIAKKSPQITMKKTLWYNLIKMNKEKMGLTLYSGKK
jgi:hypothetical protein